jgi:PAS domain S-box-containing protein
MNIRTHEPLEETLGHEELFRLAANSAPVMIWMAGLDKLCTYVNRYWLEFTGKPESAVLGEGWAQNVHPDDLDRCMGTYIAAFDKREPFRMEYRFLRRDDAYRWILVSGVPRFDDGGKFAGYIGTAVDVTENHLAQEALSRVSQSLIEAQEQERARIARELHDDMVQRAASLGYRLDTLAETLPFDSRQQVHDIRKDLTRLCLDTQALSRKLHSPNLDLFGLEQAAREYCEEYGIQQRVTVDFAVAETIPHDLPAEVALCVFRVLQEALHNAGKHSGSHQIAVRLWHSGEALHLSVSDFGKGFELEDAMKGRGLGLTSMRERLKLVNGRLSIRSKPGKGTTIDAIVPVAKALESRSGAA